jgi:hypothetical protein
MPCATLARAQVALRFFTAMCFITQLVCFAGLPQRRCETGRRGMQAGDLCAPWRRL